MQKILLRIAHVVVVFFSLVSCSFIRHHGALGHVQSLASLAETLAVQQHLYKEGCVLSAFLH